jgi:ATP-binding cassette subfamily B protein
VEASGISEDTRGDGGVLGMIRRPPGFSRLELGALAVSSAAGGLLEATALAIIAQAGVAVAEASETQLDLTLGPVGTEATIGAALAVAAAMLVVRTLLLLYAAHLPARILSRLQAQMRNELWRSYVDADYSTQAAGSDGALQQIAINHVNRASGAVLYASMGLTALLALLVMLVVAVVVQPLAAVATVALGALLYRAYRPLSEVVKRAGFRNYQAVEAIGRVVNDASRSTLDRLSFGSSVGFTKRYEGAVEQAIDPTYREFFAHGALTATYQGIVLLVLLAGLVVAAALDSSSQLGAFGAVVLIVVRSGSYLQQIQAMTQRVSETQPYRKRVAGVLDQYRRAARPVGGIELGRIETLEASDLAYAYPGTLLPVVDGFSLELTRGDLVGIAGRTGIGKTTILQLLLRLRRPDAGTYLVNGRAAHDYSEESWVSEVAFVPQEPALFQGTIAENIRMWRPIAEPEIQDSARRAHLDDDLARWDDGLEHRVDHSQVVSGGQRQRIAIARAVAGSPSLLIMDEPTSAVDRDTAARLFDSIISLRGQMGVIVVAHDPAVLELCDRVIALTAEGVQSGSR